MDRTEKLRKIRDEVRNLTSSPLYAYRKENKYYPVLGEGSHTADIMFIGEAPGQTEAKTGRPFCGAAGALLDELLSSISLNRKDVYVTNIVKDRPPGNRDPEAPEIALYAPFLLRQLDIIQPKIIATLGRFSMKFILDAFNAPEKSQSITALHGKKIQTTASYGEVLILPLYHPAVAIYNTNTKQTLLTDFKVIQELVEG